MVATKKGDSSKHTIHCFVPHITESYRVLTSSKEGKVISKIHGWVLESMQFGVLVEVLATVWRVWAHFCKIADAVPEGMQFGVLVQALLEVLNGLSCLKVGLATVGARGQGTILEQCYAGVCAGVCV